MNIRRTPVPAGLAALVLSVAACGDDDPAPTEAPPTSESMMDEPMSTEPMMDEPMSTEPMMDEPMSTEPMMDAPTTTESMG